MEITKARELFVSKCFNNGQIRSINPIFGEKYMIDNTAVKFTEEVYELIATSERVKATRTEKSANITGREGMGN